MFYECALHYCGLQELEWGGGGEGVELSFSVVIGGMLVFLKRNDFCPSLCQGCIKVFYTVLADRGDGSGVFLKIGPDKAVG